MSAILPELKEAVKTHIKRGNLDQALDLLLEKLDEELPYYDRILNLKQTLSHTEKKMADGRLTADEERKERATITFSLQEIMRNQAGTSFAPQSSSKKHNEIEQLKEELEASKESAQKSTRVAGLYFVFILAAVLTYLIIKFSVYIF